MAGTVGNLAPARTEYLELNTTMKDANEYPEQARQHPANRSYHGRQPSGRHPGLAQQAQTYRVPSTAQHVQSAAYCAVSPQDAAEIMEAELIALSKRYAAARQEILDLSEENVALNRKCNELRTEVEKLNNRIDDLYEQRDYDRYTQ